MVGSFGRQQANLDKHAGNFLTVNSLDPKSNDNQSRLVAVETSTPFKTLQKAIDAALVGVDTVRLVGDSASHFATLRKGVNVTVEGNLQRLGLVAAPGFSTSTNADIPVVEGVNTNIEEMYFYSNGQSFSIGRNLRVKRFISTFTGNIALYDCVIGSIPRATVTVGCVYHFFNTRIYSDIDLLGNANTRAQIKYAENTTFGGRILNLTTGKNTFRKCTFLGVISPKLETTSETTLFEDCIVDIDQVFIARGNYVTTQPTFHFVGGTYKTNGHKLLSASNGNTPLMVDDIVTDIADNVFYSNNGTAKFAQTIGRPPQVRVMANLDYYTPNPLL